MEVLLVAASGVDWRRVATSMGGWGADTEGADVEVPLCKRFTVFFFFADQNFWIHKISKIFLSKLNMLQLYSFWSGW